jgi:CheY-like chemotaxis protein
MDGYETAKRIRAEASSGAVILAALTGWGAQADRVKAKEAGFDHHFTKPVDPADLESVLRSIGMRQSNSATN